MSYIPECNPKHFFTVSKIGDSNAKGGNLNRQNSEKKSLHFFVETEEDKARWINCFKMLKSVHNISIVSE
jgi:hypothetical protein